jgi:hypothetical protein
MIHDTSAMSGCPNMSKLGSPLPLATALTRAVSHAESTDRRSRKILKTIGRVVQGNMPVATEQSHQQAVSDVVAYVSLLQTEIGQRRKQLNLIVNDLRTIGQILHLIPVPAGGVIPSPTTGNGQVVSLLHKRLRRYGGDRLTADMAGRVERLSGQIDQLNQIIETEFKALSDIIDR